jgi:hypothetical protein
VRRHLLAVVALAGAAAAQEGYKRTDSGRPYAHQLELVDAAGRKFDPRQPGSPPFSSQQTCKTCHDLAAIEHGWHFNAATTAVPGRPGEPWIWTDERTGTQLPLSFRGWPGTRRPDEVGLDAVGFLATFGRQLAGGAAPYTGADPSTGAFRSRGDLPVDCMICHAASRSWSHERWAKTLASEDFAWASAAAMGIAKIEGSAKGLAADFDPEAADAAERLPKTVYDPARIDLDGHVFFDLVRRPTNEACLTCHTVQRVGPEAAPRWQHDQDVHLRAGMACVDCHRNGLEHHTVRGYEGEEHPDGAAVQSLSCRGCHMDETDGHGRATARGGRLGAPKPLHRGLPTLHLDKLTCTACHSGPIPGGEAGRIQTSMSHGLGIPSQLREAGDLPFVAEPVLRRNAAGRIEPARMVWPSYWGFERDGRIEPIAPDEAFKTVRRTMRVRSRLRPDLYEEQPTAEDLLLVLGEARREVPEAEWTPTERAAIDRLLLERVEAGFLGRLAAALKAFQQAAPDGARAVAVSGGEVFRLDEAGEAVLGGGTRHPDAEPYAWAFAHEVRPARQALGADGCTDCHAAGAAFVHGTVTARGPAPDSSPRRTTMLELMELDADLVAAWEQSFEGRGAYKLVGAIAAGLVALIVLLQVFVGLGTVVRWFGGGRGEAA